jgi:hypothetical protein
MATDLEGRFHEAMLGVYDRIRDECGYPARRFLQMVKRRGGVDAARRLLRRRGISPGLAVLAKCGRLDISAEQLVLDPAWRMLFTEEEKALASAKLAQARLSV